MIPRKEPLKTKMVSFRASKPMVKLLKEVAKKIKISQSEVIYIALLELNDLLKQYPEIDYRSDLNGFLLRRVSK